jgi:hypothetical protein
LLVPIVATAKILAIKLSTFIDQPACLVGEPACFEHLPCFVPVTILGVVEVDFLPA